MLNSLCRSHNLANSFDISDSTVFHIHNLLYTLYERTMYYGTKPYEPSRMLKMSKMSIPKLFVGNHQNTQACLFIIILVGFIYTFSRSLLFNLLYYNFKTFLMIHAVPTNFIQCAFGTLGC